MKAAVFLVFAISHAAHWPSGTSQTVKIGWAAQAPVAPASLQWELRFDGVAVASGRVVLPDARQTIQIVVPVPIVRVRTMLQWRYHLLPPAGGADIDSGSLPITVYPPDLLADYSRSYAGKRVMLIDRVDTLARVLDQAKISHTRIDDVARLGLQKSDVILVAQNMLSDTPFGEGLLQEAAASGTQVLILQQSERKFLMGYRLADRNIAANFTWRPDHPLLSGFDEEELSSLIAGSARARAIQLPANEPALEVGFWPPEVSGARMGPIDALLVTKQFGAGRIVLCQLPLDNPTDDPRALLFLNNAFNYLATPFGADAATERATQGNSCTRFAGADDPALARRPIMRGFLLIRRCMHDRPPTYRPGKTAASVVVAICALLLPLSAAHAQTTIASPTSSPAAPQLAPPTTSGTSRPTTAGAPLTVAIVDFEAETPGSPGFGKQIAETLTAMLSDRAGIVLVDRAMLARTLQEHELNLTGLVKPEEAIKIGHLVGARILITGKAFTLDKSIFVTAKLIGVETSLVSGIIVKGKQDADLSELVTQLAEKVATRLSEAGGKLVAAESSAPDPLPALTARLATRKLPKVAIVASDQHIGPPALVRVIDPPIDNELRTLCTAAGLTVVDSDVKNFGKAGVGIVIKAQGFSEFAARIGNLATCTARVELTAVAELDDKTLFSDAVTQRATDLSETIAGRTALQQASHELGLRLLSKLAETLPAIDAPATKPAQ